MALVKQTERADNRLKFLFPNSYYRIVAVRFENGKVSMSVKGFGDEESRRTVLTGTPSPMDRIDNSINIREYSFSEPDLPSPALVTANESDRIKHCCYRWLKTQPEFTGATDKFENSQNTAL